MNVILLFVGMGIYDLAMDWTGATTPSQMAEKMRLLSKDTRWFSPILAYVGSLVAYAVERAVINFALLLVAIINMIID